MPSFRPNHLRPLTLPSSLGVLVERAATSIISPVCVMAALVLQAVRQSGQLAFAPCAICSLAVHSFHPTKMPCMGRHAEVVLVAEVSVGGCSCRRSPAATLLDGVDVGLRGGLAGVDLRVGVCEPIVDLALRLRRVASGFLVSDPAALMTLPVCTSSSRAAFFPALRFHLLAEHELLLLRDFLHPHNVLELLVRGSAICR